jgi:hypothetical protein
MFRGAARLIGSGTIRTSAAVTGLLIVAAAMAIVDLWVFAAPDRPGSVWNLIVEDRWTLGFVRLAVLVGSAYVATSAVAHIANGRWIRALSTSGVEVERSDVDLRIQELETQVDDLLRQRDIAYLLLEGYVGG